VPLLRALLAAGVLFLASCSSSQTLSSPSPDPSRSTLTSDRSAGVIANGTDDAVLTVTILNAQGQPLKGVNVTLAATGTGTAFTAAAATDGNGQTTSRLSATAAGVKTVSASIVGGATLAQTVSIGFVAGPGAKLGFLVPPSNIEANSAITPPVQVAVEDSFGNQVADAGASISIALEQDGGSAVLGGTLTAAAVGGVATFADLTVAQAGAGYVLSASSSGVASALSAPFDVTSGPPSALAFTAQPTGVATGVTMAPIVVSLLDSQGALDASGTATVNLALGAGCSGPNGAARLSGTLSIAAVAGVATFSDLSLDGVAQDCTLVATADGYAGATSALFDINPGEPCAAQSEIAATPTTATADGASAIQLLLTVRDCAGDPLGTEPFSIAVSGSGNLLSSAQGAGGPSVGGTTAANGEGSALLASTQAETKIVTAVFGSGGDRAILQTAVTFVAGAASAAQSSLLASPASVAAGENISLLVVLADAQGNPLGEQPFTLSASGGDSTFSNGGASGSTLGGTTNRGGISTAQLTSETVQSEQVSLTLPGAASALLTASVSFTGCQANLLTCGSGSARLCIDGQNDAQNCGACGHSCAGGACVLGLCQPVALTELDNQLILSMIAQDSTVYATLVLPGGQSGVVSSGILAIDADGTQPLLDGGLDAIPLAIVESSSQLYWSSTFGNGSNGIASMQPDGGSAGVFFDGGAADLPTSLAIDSQNIYWTAPNPGAFDAADGGVWSMPLDGGSAIAIGGNQGYPASVAMSPAGIFWRTLDDASLWRAASPSSSPSLFQSGHPIVLAGSDSFEGSGNIQTVLLATRSLVADASNVYWFDSDEVNDPLHGSVWMAPADGSAAPSLIASNQFAPAAIAVDASDVYWLNAGDNSLHAAPIAGGPARTLYLGTPGVLTIGDLALDATGIYWVEYGGSVGNNGIITTTLLRLAK